MPNIKLDFIDMAKSATSTDTINLLINMKNPDVINTLLQNNPNINEDHIQLLGELNKFPRNDEFINKYPNIVKYSEDICKYVILYDKLDKIPNTALLSSPFIKLSTFHGEAYIKNLINKCGDDGIDLLLNWIVERSNSIGYYLEDFCSTLTHFGINLNNKQIKYLSSLHNDEIDKVLIKYNYQESNEDVDTLLAQLFTEKDITKQKLLFTKISKLSLTDEQYIYIANNVNKFSRETHDTMSHIFDNCSIERIINLIIHNKIFYTSSLRYYVLRDRTLTLEEQIELLHHDYIYFKYTDELYKYIANHTEEFSDVVLRCNNIDTIDFYKYLTVKNYLSTNPSTWKVCEYLSAITFEVSTDDLKTIFEYFLSKKFKNISYSNFIFLYKQFKSIYSDKEMLDQLIEANSSHIYSLIKYTNLYKYITVNIIRQNNDRTVLPEIASVEETPIDVLLYLRHITGKGANEIKNAVKNNPTFIQYQKAEKAAKAKEDADSVRDIILDALDNGVIRQSDKDDLGIERDDNTIRNIWESLAEQDFISWKQQKYVELAKRSIM